MNGSIKKQMKLDCKRFMRNAIVASFFHRLTKLAAPIVAAWMIGDMANYLLILDKDAIANGMGAFLCAVFFQVVVSAIFNLMLNLLLTKQGFAYDGFLMEKFIRLPLQTIQNTDSGSVMERLEEDSAAFCWNQMVLYAYPGAIFLSAAVFGYATAANGCHIVFVLAIVLLAAIPVVRAEYIGKRQAELKKSVSEYNDTRKQMEQELYEARDFVKSFALDGYFVGRLRKSFEEFLKKTGIVQYRMEAKTEVLNFLCSYGVQIGTIMVGAVLISMKQLTLGALISGYMMLPTLGQCFMYIRDWVTEAHAEKKYLERLAFFYEAGGETEDSGDVLDSLDTAGVVFTYSDTEKMVLDGIDFHMTKQENYKLVGDNGSGKTTLLSILAGLYEPQSGQVCKGATLEQRRKSVALQEQDGTIFSGTIWENLFLPESKREKAAKLFEEMGMEKTMDYETTAEGANLSPGEKKKILLVRSLLRDAPFLMLDEPFNHLDQQGKQALLAQLEERKAGMLLISHQEIDCVDLEIKNYKMLSV